MKPAIQPKLECGKDLELKSFKFTRRQDYKASQCGVEDGGSGGSKRSVGEGFARRRPSLNRVPQSDGMPMEFEA